MDSTDDEEEPILVGEPGVPPGPKTVLDQETFNSCIGTIIKRDFHLEKPGYDVYTEPLATTMGDGASSCRETPSTRPSANHSNLPSLTEFLAEFVGEDHAYFHTLDLKDLARYRAKHPWMFNDSREHNDKMKEQLKLPSMEKQAAMGADGKVKEPISWPHNPQDHVFFPPMVKDPEKRSSQSTVNHNSNRLDFLKDYKPLAFPPAQTTVRLLVMPNKIGIDGKPEGESSRSGLEPVNKDSHFTMQTPHESGASSTAYHQHKNEPGTAALGAKLAHDRYYLPDASPREELAHRIYEEKVAGSIRTPKHKRNQATGTSLRSSSIFSPDSERITQALASRREQRLRDKATRK